MVDYYCLNVVRNLLAKTPCVFRKVIIHFISCSFFKWNFHVRIRIETVIIGN